MSRTDATPPGSFCFSIVKELLGASGAGAHFHLRITTPLTHAGRAGLQPPLKPRAVAGRSSLWSSPPKDPGCPPIYEREAVESPSTCLTRRLFLFPADHSSPDSDHAHPVGPFFDTDRAGSTLWSGLVCYIWPLAFLMPVSVAASTSPLFLATRGRW